MAITVATAPDSWGVWYADDPRQVGYRRYLAEVQAAGYSHTETGPYGYLPTDPHQLADELAAHDLALCGSALVHTLTTAAGLQSLIPRIHQTCALLVAMGSDHVVLMDDSDRVEQNMPRALDMASWDQLIASTLAAARVVAGDYGLKLLFHPHVGTGIETETEVERLLDDTPGDLVGLCFDFGHHAYTGADALVFMRKHHARIPYYHFKNVDPDLLNRINAEKIDFIKGFQMGVMCELDKGVVDFTQVVAFLRQIGYDGYAVVEQDMYPCPPDKPFPIARHNRTVLARLGL